MAKKLGLFTRIDARDAKKRPTAKARRGEMNAASIQALGAKGAARMNLSAEHPNMEPRGSDSPMLYVLGEAPSEDDDRKGFPFAGKSSRLLKRYISTEESDIRWNNVVRTHTPGGRPATAFEVECFRPDTIADIERTKPAVIMAVGYGVTKWLFGVTTSIDALRGRKMKVRVGTHECYVVPVNTPLQVIVEDGRHKYDGVSEYHKFFKRHINTAVIAAIQHKDEKPDRVPDTMNALRSSVTLVTSIEGARKAFKELDKISTVAFDFECFRLKPYAADALPLSIAIAGKDRVWAFPLKHKRATWTDGEYTELLSMIRKHFSTKRKAIAHSAVFDLEWLIWLVGEEVARKVEWHCTLIGSFLLDVNQGNGLGVRAQEFLGVNPKDLAEASANVKDLRREPLHNLLEYNALDALFTLWLHAEIQEEHKTRGLSKIYKLRRQCIPTLALASAEGVPVDSTVVEQLIAEGEENERKTFDLVMRSNAVKRFVRLKGPFNPKSNTDLAVLFRDVLGRTEGERDGGKYSTDAEALKPMAESGLKIAKRILAHRSATKLLSTYLHPFRLGSKKEYVYLDGKIHPTFKPTGTRTGRLASENPNAQNFPKRNGKHIRRMFAKQATVSVIGGKKTKRKWVILASDYGQIEARVIAMTSKDPRYIESLKKNLDIHMNWRDRIEDAFPMCMERFESKKAGRDKVKNGWVFPLFFGSSFKSVAQAMGLPLRIAERLGEEFWADFPTVKAWQKGLSKKYNKTGYVETLTGHRRMGPLTWNEIINTPVQGTASDIVVDAMNRIGVYAHKEKIPFLKPILNVHDDLTFIVPEEEVEFAAPIIAHHQLNTPFKFINVPLTVDIEIGPNWGAMSELRSYSSDTPLV